MATAVSDNRLDDGRFQSFPRPTDFEAMFVRIGRLACEDHYHVARITIDRWLRESGKQRLLAERTAFVASREAEKRAHDRLKEIGRLISRAIPVEDTRLISDELARGAACFLRERRNGGWPVSLSADGFWWVGTSQRSAFEMVEFAKRKGFDPASLTGGGDTKVG